MGIVRYTRGVHNATLPSCVYHRSNTPRQGVLFHSLQDVYTIHLLILSLGTVLSGFAVFCCGKTRLDSKEDETSSVFCTNCWVGFAQLFTVTFMLVGWFWSLTWGIYMVILAGMLTAT